MRYYYEEPKDIVAKVLAKNRDAIIRAIENADAFNIDFFNKGFEKGRVSERREGVLESLKRELRDCPDIQFVDSDNSPISLLIGNHRVKLYVTKELIESADFVIKSNADEEDVPDFQLNPEIEFILVAQFQNVAKKEPATFALYTPDKFIRRRFWQKGNKNIISNVLLKEAIKEHCANSVVYFKRAEPNLDSAARRIWQEARAQQLDLIRR